MKEVVSKLRSPLEHACFRLGRERSWRDSSMRSARNTHLPSVRREYVRMARWANQCMVRDIRLLQLLRAQP